MSRLLYGAKSIYYLISIFNSISGLYGGKLSTTIKQLALEKIEDEYNLQLIKDFESREEKGEITLIEFDDLKKEFDL